MRKAGRLQAAPEEKKNLDALFARMLGSNQAAGRLRTVFIAESRRSRRNNE